MLYSFFQRFSRTILVFAGFYEVLSAFTKIDWILPSFTGLHLFCIMPRFLFCIFEFFSSFLHLSPSFYVFYLIIFCYIFSILWLLFGCLVCHCSLSGSHWLPPSSFQLNRVSAQFFNVFFCILYSVFWNTS